MFDELAQLDTNGVDYQGRLKISTRAQLVSQIQIEADGASEEKLEKAGNDTAIGTTRRGIGPTYASKALRIGLRAGDLADWTSFKEKYNYFVDRFQWHFPSEAVQNFDRQAELDQLHQLYEKFNGSQDRMLVDSVDYMHNVLKDPTKRIIAEGANATMLDMDFGTYPYVTSSSTTIGGVCTGLGLPPQAVETSIGIVKAYTTRVGAGPFPTFLPCEIGDKIQSVGHEWGATTGRRRKCGWLDLNVVNYANKINGFSSINLTKLDVLTGIDTLRVATHYELDGKKLDGSMPADVNELARCTPIYVDLPGWTEDITTCKSFESLPTNAQNYIRFIEEQTQVPITWVGTGPAREEMFSM